MGPKHGRGANLSIILGSTPGLSLQILLYECGLMGCPELEKGSEWGCAAIPETAHRHMPLFL